MVRWVLQTPTVVVEAGLVATWGCIRLDRLHLALERVVDALSLVDRVVQVFRAGNRLHGHVRAQWHALVDVAGRGQRVGPLLLRVPSIRARVWTT